MNIPVTELHNDSAPWYYEDFKRCLYCESTLELEQDNYCDESCEDNHISDMHNELIGLVGELEWKMEKHLQLSDVIYKRAFELNLIDTCNEILEMAKENNYHIEKLN